MQITMFFKLLCEIFYGILRKASCEKGTIKAHRSYEREAYHDYKKTNNTRLKKNERIPDAVLLEVKKSPSTNQVLTVINRYYALKGFYPTGYIERFVHIWEYKEKIDNEE